MSEEYKEIVIDEGSNQVKTCWFDGKKIRCEVFPSRVVNKARMGSDENRMLSTYKIGAQKFTVADRMDNPIQTDIPEEYQVSRCNRILVHEALRRHGFGGQSVNITTTLPVSLFFNEDEKNHDLIKDKQKNLTDSDIENLAGQTIATVKKCEVKPEAIPAWFDMILDDFGQIKVNTSADHKIMVADIGGTTTDISLIDGLGNIQEFKSLEGGVFQIGANLKSILIEETSYSHLEVFEIEDCLKSKIFDGADIHQQIENASYETVSAILSVMRRLYKESKRLDAVLYVGGGSALIGKMLAKQYGGNSAFGDQFSIARGILKNYMHRGVISVGDSE